MFTFFFCSDRHQIPTNSGCCTPGPDGGVSLVCTTQECLESSQSALLVRKAMGLEGFGLGTCHPKPARK